MTDKDSMKSSIIRCVRMIECLAEANGPIAMGRIAAQLDLAPSTTHRILGQLREEGLVTHDSATSAYRPGPGLIRIAAMIMANTPFQKAYVQSLEMLAATSDETSFFAAYMPAMRKLRFAHVVPTSQPIQYVMEQGKACSVLFGASGRAIAAYLPELLLREMYNAETGSTDAATMLPSFEELLRQFAEIRENGYAISSGERVRGAHAIVAPIFTENGEVMGSLGISMPVFRGNRERDAELAVLVKAEAERLSRLLGDTRIT